MSRARLAVLLAVAVAATLVVVGVLLGRSRDAAARRALVAHGERLYRLGQRPSGEPVRATVRGDITLDGAMVTCRSCHLRSGLGSVEGRVAAPPVTAESLFQPAKRYFKYVEVLGAPPRRPAYTRETLGVALRTGVDPTGRTLGEAMPRYQLAEDDLTALVAYLGELSAPNSPGVADDTIQLATVITDDVSAEEREALLFVLRRFVAFQTAQAQPREMGVDNRSARMSTGMLGREAAYQRFVLTPWLLHGGPETWRAQLEALYDARAPFALVSGMTRDSWAPIHAFAEDHQLPTLLPVARLPVLSPANTSTLYASEGVHQEGEGVARYLASLPPAARPSTVVQVVRDTPLGRALQAGFEETAAELGLPRARAVLVPAGEPVPSLGALEAPAAVLLWDGPEGLPALEQLTQAGPVVFLSSTAVGPAFLDLPEARREQVFLAWPYRLPDDEVQYASVLRPWLEHENPLDLHQPGLSPGYRAAAAAYAATQVLTQGLMDLRGHYSRDYLLDVVGMMRDQRLPGFERLSFGLGQRTLAEGCRIVRLGPGPAPKLVKQSEWLTH